MKNFEIIHLMGTKTTLVGLTRISRNRKVSPEGTETQFSIRPTYYTIRVECEHFKGLTGEQMEAIKPIVELAFDQMAIRSSSYLIDRAASEKEVHALLGDGVEKVSVSKDGKEEVSFKGGRLELKYNELYAQVKRAPKALDVASMSDEQAQMLLKQLLARMEAAKQPV